MKGKWVRGLEGAKKQVSADEVVGTWLKREFEGNWERHIMPLVQVTPSLTKEKLKAIVDNPNYQNDIENILRLMTLHFRLPLLFPCWNAEWYRKSLSETEFTKLMVIRSKNWNILSAKTGKLSVVSERVLNEPELKDINQDVREIIDAIESIGQSRISDGNLILLESDDSEYVTILEGNKTATTLYIKYYLKNELQFKPFEVFIGHLDTRILWQW